MTKLISWRMVGGSYARDGQYLPGFTEVTVEGGLKTRFHSEKYPMTSIIIALEAEGVDCEIFHHWVKAGEGPTFTLS